MVETISRSQRLHEALGRIIAETEPGDRLVTEPELARQLGVSRATLREAMRTFETQGLIRRRQGSGTYVVRPPHVIETGLEVLESIETMAKRTGVKVEMGELKINCRLANPEEQEALSLEPGSSVLHLSRIIITEGRQAAFLVDVLPEDVLPISELESGFTGSVLDLLLKRGDPLLENSRTDINAVPASSEVARALGIQRGDVLLRFVAYLYSPTGRIVDYSYSYFLPGYFRFHVVRSIHSLNGASG
jgi:GntR family transcriptional regulator